MGWKEYIQITGDYETYLKSEHWHKMREIAFERYGKKCQKCGSETDLQVHHLSYARIGEEQENDLSVLCRSCHSEITKIIKDEQMEITSLLGSEEYKKCSEQAVEAMRPILEHLLDIMASASFDFWGGKKSKNKPHINKSFFMVPDDFMIQATKPERFHNLFLTACSTKSQKR